MHPSTMRFVRWGTPLRLSLPKFSALMNRISEEVAELVGHFTVAWDDTQSLPESLQRTLDPKSAREVTNVLVVRSYCKRPGDVAAGTRNLTLMKVCEREVVKRQ